jgi:hypothetical protein
MAAQPTTRRQIEGALKRLMRAVDSTPGGSGARYGVESYSPDGRRRYRLVEYMAEGSGGERWITENMGAREMWNFLNGAARLLEECEWKRWKNG